MSIDDPAHETAARISAARDLRRWVRALIIPVTILAWGALVIAVFVLAGHLVETLIILAVAVLLAYALSPLINLLNRWMPRPLAVTMTYLLFGGVLAGLLYLVASAAVREVTQLGEYIKRLARDGSNSPLWSILHQFGVSRGNLNNLGQVLLSRLGGTLGEVFPIISTLVTALVGLIVILVLSIYFAAAGPTVRRWLQTGTPLSQRERVHFFLATFDAKVGGYIRGQTTLAAIIGLLVGLGMELIFHLPFAVLLGLLAFLLEYIPFLGVIVSGGACVLVALTQGPLIALLVLAYFILVHMVEAEIVGPRIVGRAVGLHPAVSLISLIAGAELFGLWGALFASPVAGVVQALILTFWSEYRRLHPEEFPRLAATEAALRAREAELGPRRWQRPPDFRGIFFRWRRPVHP